MKKNKTITTNEQNEMKPCPFCGGKPELYLYYDRKSLLIECDECGARIFGYRSIDEIIEAWNKRTKQKSIRKEKR